MKRMDLLFATNNQHKRKEVQSLLPEAIRLVTLEEAGINVDVPEPFETLPENALHKIRFVLKESGLTAGFSEDSGLFIESLQGRPGVHSAHYAGPKRNDAENIERVLEGMKEDINRTAYFQTTICLIWDHQEHFFTGICHGNITRQLSGSKGFGYDPIFQPAGADRTFAEMDLIEKNRYSHRQKAVQQLIDFLHHAKKTG